MAGAVARCGRWARGVLLSLGVVLLIACQSAGPPAATSSPGSGSAAAPAASPLAAAGGAAAAATSPTPLIKLTSAYAVLGSPSLPALVAKEAGLFERNGLDVDLVNVVAANRVVATVLSGEAPIGVGGEIIETRLAGGDLVMLAMFLPRWTYLLVAQPSIGSLEELRGKRLGVTSPSGTAAHAARYAIRLAGLRPGEDVILLATGGHPERLAALQTGELDSGLLQLPHSTVAVRSGLRQLLDFRSLDYTVPSGFVIASRAWINQNEDVTRRYLRAIVEAIHFLKTSKAETLAIMGRVFKTDDMGVLEEVLEEVARLVADVPYPTAQALRNQIDAQAEDNPAVRSVAVEDIYDDRFLRELEAEGFVRRLYGR